MRTSAAGNKPASLHSAQGFTLLELLVVVALIAIATAGVSLSLRDSADSALERDATRLAALLETARAQARASGRHESARAGLVPCRLVEQLRRQQPHPREHCGQDPHMGLLKEECDHRRRELRHGCHLHGACQPQGPQAR